MANYYWIGGTATWDGTAEKSPGVYKWASASGGPAVTTVPTSTDNAFFDANSGTGTVTLGASGAVCANLNFTGFTGTLGGSGATQVEIYGNLVVGSGMTWSSAGLLWFRSSGSASLTSNGKTISSDIEIQIGAASVFDLNDALTTTSSITVTQGEFYTGTYNVTCTSLISTGSSTRAITLLSSTITLSGATAVDFDSTGLTLDAGTSQINITNVSPSFTGGGKTFYNVSFTSNALTDITITNGNTFNNLTITGRNSAGVNVVTLNSGSNQTVNGTFQVTNSGSAICRTRITSAAKGTTRTITCASIASMRDVDFSDITIAGAAAPLSGTRLGDCKGNSGITFVAGKTVYFRGTSTSDWGATGSWSATSGGASDVTQFPLAQDTAIFPAATYPASGSTITVNADYALPTVDMSLRTSNTMSLSIGARTIYGSLICGTGANVTSVDTLTFAGRTTQDVTCAGNTLACSITVDSVGGTVRALDAFSINSARTLTITRGTFNANDFNLTCGSVSSSNSNTRTIAIGSGTWTVSGSGSTAWNCATSTGLTVTGAGTISMTSASAKTFAGGGVQTYPTLNQGGAGQLTVSGSNKFADITNTYKSTGATSVLFTAGTNNTFTAFNLNGEVGRVCTLGSTTTSQATLTKGPIWRVGANSTNGGNNTNLFFVAGGGIDYLSISYINGVATEATGGGNFFMFFN